jgi:hypothetical protein
VRFCSGKRAVLVVEEGQPDFIEQAASQILRRVDVQARLAGKDMLPMTGSTPSTFCEKESRSSSPNMHRTCATELFGKRRSCRANVWLR